MEINMKNLKPTNYKPYCVKCGGDLIGDGYTSALRCEFADMDDWEELEADASPVYCDFEEDEL